MFGGVLDWPKAVGKPARIDRDLPHGALALVERLHKDTRGCHLKVMVVFNAAEPGET